MASDSLCDWVDAAQHHAVAAKVIEADAMAAKAIEPDAMNIEDDMILTDEEWQKLEQLVSVFGRSAKQTAKTALTSVGWDLERAVEFSLDHGANLATSSESANCVPTVQPRTRWVSEDSGQQRLQERDMRNAAWREERAAQDAEYQEALLIDQQRDAERLAAEAALRQEEHARRQAAEAAQLAEEHRQATLQLKRERLARAHVDVANADRRQLMVRVPSGRRIMRNFLGSDQMSSVYDWVDVACSDEEFTRNNYALVAHLPGQPRTEFTEMESSLEVVGLAHQTMLFVVASD